MRVSETIWGNQTYKISSSFGEGGRKGKKETKKSLVFVTSEHLHKKTVEGIYSNSLGCSIRVIVQSGFAPSVNSLWNLQKERW